MPGLCCAFYFMGKHGSKCNKILSEGQEQENTGTLDRKITMMDLQSDF